MAGLVEKSLLLYNTIIYVYMDTCKESYYLYTRVIIHIDLLIVGLFIIARVIKTRDWYFLVAGTL